MSYWILRGGINLRLRNRIYGDKLTTTVSLPGAEDYTIEDGEGSVSSTQVKLEHTSLASTEVSAWQYDNGSFGQQVTRATMEASATVSPGLQGFVELNLKRVWRRLPKLNLSTPWFEPIELSLGSGTVPVLGNSDRHEDINGMRYESNDPLYTDLFDLYTE